MSPTFKEMRLYLINLYLGLGFEPQTDNIELDFPEQLLLQ